MNWDREILLEGALFTSVPLGLMFIFLSVGGVVN